MQMKWNEYFRAFSSIQLVVARICHCQLSWLQPIVASPLAVRVFGTALGRKRVCSILTSPLPPPNLDTRQTLDIGNKTCF